MPATALDDGLAPIDFLRATMTGLHSLCSQGPGHPFQAVGFYSEPDGLLAHALTESAAGRNVWFGVHALERTPQRGRGGADDVAEVRQLVADLDWHDPDAHKATHGLPAEHEVRARLDTFTPAPTIVVATGHGLQAYWLLREPVSPADGAALTLRLHAALTAAGLVPDRHDLASVLRVPGTHNRKTTPPPLVRVEAADLACTYSADRLGAELPARVVATPAREPLPQAPAGLAARTPLDGDDSIAAWVNQSLAWHQLLQADGWQYAGTSAGDSQWTRPGKAVRDGISAVLHEPDGPLTVFTTAVPMLQQPWATTAKGQGWTFGRFGYIAATRHNGDRSAAARDARLQRNATEMRTHVLAAGAQVASSIDAEADPDADGEFTDLPPLLVGIADGTLTLIVPTILETTP